MPTPYALSSDLVSAWPAKSLEVATYLDTSLAAKTDTAMTQNAQTGTSYSYVLLDAAKLLTMNNAASNTVTVTKQATVTWVTGTQLRVMNLGAGTTTLVADTGVTINGNVALKQYQGGTLIRTASDVWLFVPTASSSGMDLITPTSVAGSGVTLSGAVVSFSAATTVSVNGCFSATYSTYIALVNYVGSTNVDVSMRMRAAGSDASGAGTYSYTYIFGQSGGAGGGVGTSTSFLNAIQGNTNKSTIKIDLFDPFAAAQTAAYIYSGSSYRNYLTSGSQTDSTSFDGFSIFPAAGNLTGSLRVYGLRNS